MAHTTAVVPTGPIEDAPKPHTTSHNLQDQAATAALYVTNANNKSSAKNGHEFLDSNNRLSSAGAAASLKYANPQDLPSFPSRGLKNDDSAAGAAASLGWANQKPFEHWKPDPSSSAHTAATLAKDYKMAPLWQPGQSTNGAKAALLAHKSEGKVEIWKPESSSWGNSAANQAFQKHNAGNLSPQVQNTNSAIDRKGSLLAATGAMSSSRKRAESTPMPPPKPDTYPDQSNSLSNALKAATSASRAKRPAHAPEGGAVPFTNMSREMYTSNPPVTPEVEEKSRNDTLRASAVAMAKSMYNIQQKQIDAASSSQRAATAAHQRTSSTANSDDMPAPMRFNNLQEAAHKLAQERLAKLHDEHAQNRDYRDYYGSHSKESPSRLSIRSRTRRRASSDGNLDEDKEQSNKIRSQMSIFTSNVNAIDTKKRQADREALIATAQRNVTKQLHGMDEKVFADTGNVAPSLLNDWELKAHAAAQAKSDARLENYGKVDIGGGRFVNQSAVNLVAARNVQPVLDEINEKAEKERVRQAAIKLEQENAAKKAATDKAKSREEKEINKKLHRDDKEAKKAREAEEKAAKDEEKRLAKERRKSLKSGAVTPTLITEPKTAENITEPHGEDEPIAKPVKETDPVTETTDSEAEVKPTPAAVGDLEASRPNIVTRTSMEDAASIRMQEAADAAKKDESTMMSPSTMAAGNGRVKSWLKTKFARRSSRGQKSPKDTENNGFQGGAALTGASREDISTPVAGTSQSAITSAAAVTDVSKDDEDVTRGRKGKNVAVRSESEVSSLSSDAKDVDEDEFQEARDNFDDDLAPPPKFGGAKSSSPARDSRFSEDI